MKFFKFQCNGFSGSIKGINGNIVEDAKKEEAIAELCTLEVVKDDTFKTWKTCIKNDDLDGVVLEDIPNMVSAISNAVNDDTPAISLRLEETCNGGLSMVLSMPGYFRSIPIKFYLEAVEQDELSVLKQRVDALTLELRESRENENKVQQQQEES